MKLDFKNRVILVTGAARGLGLAYSKSLIEAGATVVMQDGGVNPDGSDPDPEIIAKAAAELGSDRIFAIPGLLNSKADCKSVIAKVVNNLGRIDGLIANAGVVIWKETTQVDEATFKSSSAVNHEAAFWLCAEALPHMQKAGFGRIVLTTSGWALGPYPGSGKLALYCQSKGAQFGLGMALAEGAGDVNIRTNVIAPIANTRIYASDVEPDRLKPESVAGTVTWLVSPECDINGRLLKIADGNLSILELQQIGSETLGDDAQDPVRCGEAIQKMLSAKIQGEENR